MFEQLFTQPATIAHHHSSPYATERRQYLRKILIHGARAAVLRIKRDRAPIGAWLDALDHRAPKNVVVVAMANKLARIAWAVLSRGDEYRPVAA
jgi:transposase